MSSWRLGGPGRRWVRSPWAPWHRPCRWLAAAAAPPPPGAEARSEILRLGRLLEEHPHHAESLVQSLSPDGRRALTIAGIASALQVNPKTADLNRDGVVSESEMLTWMRLATAEKHSMVAAQEREAGQDDDGVLLFPPTPRQLLLYALSVGIPFIGFGFMDNSIMIVSGDLIDHHLGVYLGISILASAALGNLISDVAGVAFGGVIDGFFRRLGLPPHNLTAAQHTARAAKGAALVGGMVGVSIGCLLGMFPLLFFDVEKDKRLRQVFQDVDVAHRGKVPVTELSVLLDRAGPGYANPAEGAVARFLHDRGISGAWDQVAGEIDMDTWLTLVKTVGAKP